MFDLSEEGIRTLISRGEGLNIEFKTTLVPTKVLDALTDAFLNSEGGIVVLGIKKKILEIGINKCARDSGFDRKHFIRKLVREVPVKRNSYVAFVRWIEARSC
jgi:hypothetical protein